jgi:hypothetical protein
MPRAVDLEAEVGVGPPARLALAEVAVGKEFFGCCLTPRRDEDRKQQRGQHGSK